MDDHVRRRLEALLDLLTEEVARRLDERSASGRAEPDPSPIVRPAPAPVSAPEATPEPDHEPTQEPPPELGPHLAGDSSSHTAVLLARFAVGVFLIVALINVPLTTQGTALARSIPSTASLVIRNGLVVKEATSPEIWVYRDGAFHWITSLDAFTHYGYQWQDVHIVEPGFVKQFPTGSPLYVLLKCDSSPHIYLLDGGRKRWVVDIPTFTAQGYVWQDVEMVPCFKLRSLPDGDSIPPGRGSPPPPLP